MKFFKSHKIYKILMTIFIIYAVYTFINQQIKLNSYQTEKSYYEDQIAALSEEKAALEETKANINTPEYIEKVAREKLDMYYPNERVYIDVSK